MIQRLRFYAAEDRSAATRAATLQAIDTLHSWLGTDAATTTRLTPPQLSQYVDHLICQGYTTKTIHHYLKRLGSLYSRIDSGAADTLARLRRQLRDLPDRPAIDGPAVIDTLRSMTVASGFSPAAQPARQTAKGACTRSRKADTLGADMLIFALLQGGLTPAQLAGWRKDTPVGDQPVLQAIVRRYARPRRTYLFPLDHNNRSTARLAGTAEALVEATAARAGLPTAPRPADTPLLLWHIASVASGFSQTATQGREAASGTSPTATHATLPHPTLLSLLAPADATWQRPAPEAVKAVADYLTADPLSWYALRLRRGVDQQHILDRLDAAGLTPAATYYPIEEIMKRVGHRKIFQTRPVIAWLLFMRERPSRIRRILSAVGDLAWGYRTSRRADAPLAVIPPYEIAMYQTAIGTFSSDTVLQPQAATPLRPGDRVIIIGGLFAGHHGTILKTPAAAAQQASVKATAAGSPAAQEKETAAAAAPAAGPQGRIIYRILLEGGTAAEWTVDQDPRLLRPAP